MIKPIRALICMLVNTFTYLLTWLACKIALSDDDCMGKILNEWCENLKL